MEKFNIVISRDSFKNHDILKGPLEVSFYLLPNGSWDIGMNLLTDIASILNDTFRFTSNDSVKTNVRKSTFAVSPELTRTCSADITDDDLAKKAVHKAQVILSLVKADTIYRDAPVSLIRCVNNLIEELKWLENLLKSE